MALTEQEQEELELLQLEEEEAAAAAGGGGGGGGAKGAFERGEPGSSLYPDIRPSMGPQAGKVVEGAQQPGMPVNPAKRLLRRASAAALPFGLGEKAVETVTTGVGLETKEQIAAEKKAMEFTSDDQLDMLGELAGFWAGGQVFRGLGAVAGTGSKLLGQTADKLGQLGDRVSVGVVRLSQGAAEKMTKMFGDDALETAGRLLKDSGVTNQPKLLSTVVEKLNKVRETSGQQLDRLYTLLDKEVKATDGLTPPEVVKMVTDKMSAQAAEQGVQVSADVLEKVQKVISNSFGTLKQDLLLMPSNLWKEARKLERAANKWTKTDPDRAGVMGEVAGAIRSYLDDLAQAVPSVAGEESIGHKLVQLNREYSMFRQLYNSARKELIRRTRGPAGVPTSAQKLLETPLAPRTPVETTTSSALYSAEDLANLGKRVLGYGEKLSKYKARLVSAGTRGLSAVSKLHGYLRTNDPQYQRLINKLEREEEAGSNGQQQQ